MSTLCHTKISKRAASSNGETTKLTLRKNERDRNGDTGRTEKKNLSERKDFIRQTEWKFFGAAKSMARSLDINDEPIQNDFSQKTKIEFTPTEAKTDGSKMPVEPNVEQGSLVPRLRTQMQLGDGSEFGGNQAKLRAIGVEKSYREKPPSWITSSRLVQVVPMLQITSVFRALGATNLKTIAI